MSDYKKMTKDELIATVEALENEKNVSGEAAYRLTAQNDNYYGSVSGIYFNKGVAYVSCDLEAEAKLMSDINAARKKGDAKLLNSLEAQWATMATHVVRNLESDFNIGVEEINFPKNGK